MLMQQLSGAGGGNSAGAAGGGSTAGIVTQMDLLCACQPPVRALTWNVFHAVVTCVCHRTAACAACLPMLMGLLGGSSKPPSGGGGGGAAPNPLPGGVPVHLPGQKPPADEQLPDDKGILITGCQSFET